MSCKYLAHHKLKSVVIVIITIVIITFIIVVVIVVVVVIVIIVVMQKIDAEEAAIWEEMLSAADLVQEEARQRYKKSKESKEVHAQRLKNLAPYTPK